MSVDSTDVQAAIDVCARFFASIDDRNWEHFVDCLAPTVTTDFTDLWGGEPNHDSATDLAAGWSRLFDGFTATQHLVGGYTVTPTAPNPHDLVLAATFQATHHGDDPFGSPTWTLYGTYRVGLNRTDDGDLRIAGLYQTPTFGVGNRNVVIQAVASTAA